MRALKCFCEEAMTLEPNAQEWCATSCGHMFHYLCLVQWLERSKTCPYCVKPVWANNMFRLYPAELEEKPEDEISEVLQVCLDSTQGQLEDMTKLCKKKDGIIASLKVDADNGRNFRRDTEALKSLLQTFDGESLDELFDDPNNFEEVLKGKVAVLKLEETAKNRDATQQTTEASTADAEGAAAKTSAVKAKVVNKTTKPSVNTPVAQREPEIPSASVANPMPGGSGNVTSDSRRVYYDPDQVRVLPFALRDTPRPRRFNAWQS